MTTFGLVVEIPDLALIIAVALLAYALLVKSPLVRLWWGPLSPVLHRLGFRCVVMDMSFGIHAIRWQREWVDIKEGLL